MKYRILVFLTASWHRIQEKMDVNAFREWNSLCYMINNYSFSAASNYNDTVLSTNNKIFNYEILRILNSSYFFVCLVAGSKAGRHC